MDPLADPAAGDVSPLVNKLGTVRAVIESARAFRRGKAAVARGVPVAQLPLVPATMVMVRNDTGSDLSTFSVLTPADYVVDPDAEPFEARRKPAVAAVAPESEDDLVLVTWEPIAAGEIGRAAVTGVAVVSVEVTDDSHEYAVPAAGDTTKLVSAASGPCRLLITSSGTTDRKHYVLLNATSPATPVFFARLTAESDGKWKFVPLTLDDSGEWVDAGDESDGYYAVPSTIDGSVYPAAAGADVRVLMKLSATPSYDGYPQYEFQVQATTTVFKVTGAAGGGGYPWTLQGWDGSGWVDADLTGSNLQEVNGHAIPADTRVVVTKTPGNPNAWVCQYTPGPEPEPIEVGCGLAYSDGTEGEQLVVDLTEVVFDGLTFDSDNCVLSWRPGCGMAVVASPDEPGQDAVGVDYAALAGEAGLSSLVVHDPVSPNPCTFLAVDLDPVADATAEFDKIVGFGMVEGKLRLSYERRSLTVEKNLAGLPVNVALGEPAAGYYELDFCLAGECCNAEELVISDCTRDPSSGDLETVFEITTTISGGVPPYTILVDWGDEETDTALPATHTYVEGGEYSPQVTVTDSCGTEVTCSPGTITVTGDPCAEAEEISTPYNTEITLVGDDDIRWWKFTAPADGDYYFAAIPDVLESHAIGVLNGCEGTGEEGGQCLGPVTLSGGGDYWFYVVNNAPVTTTFDVSIGYTSPPEGCGDPYECDGCNTAGTFDMTFYGCDGRYAPLNGTTLTFSYDATVSATEGVPIWSATVVAPVDGSHKLCLNCNPSGGDFNVYKLNYPLYGNWDNGSGTCDPFCFQITGIYWYSGGPTDGMAYLYTNPGGPPC